MDLDGEIARHFSGYPANTVNGMESATDCTILLSGSLDLQYSNDLQRLLTCIIGDLGIQKKLVIDLEFVNYISSTGIGAFTNALIAAKRRNIHFYLRNIQPKVRSVFTVLGLMDFFTEMKTHG